MYASLATVAFATLAAASPLSLRSEFATGPFKSCSASDLSQLSCHNTTAVADSCCNEVGGGQILSTQFWDFDPATGPSASWTLHGLWPDLCDGTYKQFCDPKREITGPNVTTILENYGQHNLLRYMRRYWKDISGDDSNLWYHEYNKHGTCMSTVNPSCYTKYTPEKDVADYFYKAVEVYKTLDTYEMLKEAGIVPSLTKNYTLSAIQGVFNEKFGVNVTLGCTKKNQLNEVWYHFNVKNGGVLNGEYVHTQPDGSKSTCKETNIQYVPKKKAN